MKPKVSMKPERNDPCPCGSGEIFEICCQEWYEAKSSVKKVEPTANECNQLVALFNAAHLMELESRARLLLEQYPESGFIWSMLGAALQAQGKDGLSALQNATKFLPNNAEVHSNLGNALCYLNRLDEAEASYRRALEIKPDFAEAHNSLGIILKNLGQFDEAVTCYHRALEIKPDFAAAHGNLGIVLKNLGQFDDAVMCYRRVLELKPDYAEAYGNLGIALKAQGKLDEALACFQQQARMVPENSVLQHYIASLSGKNTERAPIQYVEDLFDSYARRFDTHLQQELKYDVPEKLVVLITQHSTPPAEKWNVLDLGCGTGLVGLAIAPFARQLVGVDLSAKMLEKAHTRNLYQRLERLDLLTMMRREKTASYNIIIAADVFIYLGKLDEIISEIKRLLCPCGVFAFSIETLVALSNEETSRGIQREYQLEKTGRYSHSHSYITRLASDNGFLSQEMAATQLRLELGEPINGCLVVWKS